jgi:uncharacterized protein
MNNQLSKKLRQLDEFLLSDAVTDDCMLLSELDGFLAGIIVCPDMVMPSEWMPVIWAGEGPIFETMEQIEAINGTIMWLYNDIIRQLDRRRYTPIFDVDTRNDETLWETWIVGFHKALTLRPNAWLSLGHGKAHKALSTFMRLHQIATTPSSDLEPMDEDGELISIAPELIPFSVEELHRERLGQAQSPKPPANQNLKQVGRNDPCPCGSGKKFKKCCLH